MTLHVSLFAILALQGVAKSNVFGLVMKTNDIDLVGIVFVSTQIHLFNFRIQRYSSIIGFVYLNMKILVKKDRKR